MSSFRKIIGSGVSRPSNPLGLVFNRNYSGGGEVFDGTRRESYNVSGLSLGGFTASTTVIWASYTAAWGAGNSKTVAELYANSSNTLNIGGHQLSTIEHWGLFIKINNDWLLGVRLNYNNRLCPDIITIGNGIASDSTGNSVYETLPVGYAVKVASDQYDAGSSITNNVAFDQWTAAPSTLYVGQGQAGTNGWIGNIYQISIYNRRMSDVELAAAIDAGPKHYGDVG